MYVYEVLDHTFGKVLGIYVTMEAAVNKIMEVAGESYRITKFSRYRIWPNYVKDVIYEPEVDCMYQEDPREREFDNFDHTDINAVPF